MTKRIAATLRCELITDSNPRSPLPIFWCRGAKEVITDNSALKTIVCSTPTIVPVPSRDGTNTMPLSDIKFRNAQTSGAGSSKQTAHRSQPYFHLRPLHRRGDQSQIIAGGLSSLEMTQSRGDTRCSFPKCIRHVFSITIITVAQSIKIGRKKLCSTLHGLQRLHIYVCIGPS